jgi:hypothetical protein
MVRLPSYRGPIETVEHALLAGMVLDNTCQRCNRPRAEWAYKLLQRRPSARRVPLNKAVDGFYCLGCRHRVTVYISARREGEF